MKDHKHIPYPSPLCDEIKACLRNIASPVNSIQAITFTKMLCIYFLVQNKILNPVLIYYSDYSWYLILFYCCILHLFFLLLLRYFTC